MIAVSNSLSARQSFSNFLMLKNDTCRKFVPCAVRILSLLCCRNALACLAMPCQAFFCRCIGCDLAFPCDFRLVLWPRMATELETTVQIVQRMKAKIRQHQLWLQQHQHLQRSNQDRRLLSNALTHQHLSHCLATMTNSKKARSPTHQLSRKSLYIHFRRHFLLIHLRSMWSSHFRSKQLPTLWRAQLVLIWSRPDSKLPLQLLKRSASIVLAGH